MGIIVKPLVTEKQTKTTEKFGNRYGFVVLRQADKTEIKKAIEELYDVKVVKINTLIMPAKRKSRYTKAGLIRGQKNAFKKAIVTVKEGDVIDIYSNI